MMLTFQNMRGRPALGGASDQSSASRGGAILPRNSIPNYLTARASVGLREGRLSERSPADRRRGAQAVVHNRSRWSSLAPFSSRWLSAARAFLKSLNLTQAVIDGAAVVVNLTLAFLLLCSVAGAILGAIFLTFFCSF